MSNPWTVAAEPSTTGSKPSFAERAKMGKHAKALIASGYDKLPAWLTPMDNVVHDLYKAAIHASRAGVEAAFEVERLLDELHECRCTGRDPSPGTLAALREQVAAMADHVPVSGEALRAMSCDILISAKTQKHLDSIQREPEPVQESLL